MIVLSVSCGGRTIGSLGEESATGSTCRIPAETILLSPSGGVGRPRSLRATADHLYVLGYVAEERLQYLARIDKQSGALERFPLGPSVTHLAVGSTHAYFGSSTSGLSRTSLSFASGSERVAQISGELQAIEIAPDESVFWSTSVRGGVHGAVYELAPNAAEPKPRMGGDHYTLFVDASYIFSVVQEKQRAWLWHVARNGDLSRGSDVGRFVVDFTVDGAEIFLATPEAILRKPRELADVVELAPNQTSPAALALDATHVYFTDAGSYHDDLPPPKPANIPGSIRRVPRAGGPVEVLAVEGRGVSSIAVDACAVYWISERGLVRRAK